MAWIGILNAFPAARASEVIIFNGFLRKPTGSESVLIG